MALPCEQYILFAELLHPAVEKKLFAHVRPTCGDCTTDLIHVKMGCSCTDVLRKTMYSVLCTNRSELGGKNATQGNKNVESIKVSALNGIVENCAWYMCK